MPTRKAHHLVTATAAVVIGCGIAPTAAHAQSGLVVQPGGSIQAAVDRAHPGQTIKILPGVYRENVRISVPRLTLLGSGARTVITPGPGGPRSACADAGICVAGRAGHPVTGVRISSLTVTGFKKAGIWGMWTDRMTVRGVFARGNRLYGIGQELSTRARFRYNTATGNGQAGIMLANVMDREGGAIDTRHALIRGNRLSGNSYGVVIRRARNLLIARNVINGNCGGVFIVGDENVPRAGELTVRGNDIFENNKLCPRTKRLPQLQGAGIVLTGAEKTLVADNRIRRNIGHTPFSGGIVLFRSMAGAPNAHHTIRGNIVLGNVPADLADRDRRGAGNRFFANQCRVSEAAGRC